MHGIPVVLVLNAEKKNLINKIANLSGYIIFQFEIAVDLSLK